MIELTMEGGNTLWVRASDIESFGESAEGRKTVKIAACGVALALHDDTDVHALSSAVALHYIGDCRYGGGGC